MINVKTADSHKNNPQTHWGYLQIVSGKNLEKRFQNFAFRFGVGTVMISAVVVFATNEINAMNFFIAQFF